MSQSRLVQKLEFKIYSLRTLGLSPLYTVVERFVLDKGTLRRGGPLPSPHELMPIKECFRNAYQMAISNTDLTYVEGFAGRRDLPIEFKHAWLQEPNGRIVDPTWRDTDELTEYIGIPIPTRTLLETTARNETYGVLWIGISERPNLELIRAMGGET